MFSAADFDVQDGRGYSSLMASVQELLLGAAHATAVLVVFLLLLDLFHMFPLRILVRQVGNSLRIRRSLSSYFSSRRNSTKRPSGNNGYGMEMNQERTKSSPNGNKTAPAPIQERVFHYEFTALPSDCDMYLHMNNCEYNKHLENARVRRLVDFPSLVHAGELLAKLKAATQAASAGPTTTPSAISTTSSRPANLLTSTTGQNSTDPAPATRPNKAQAPVRAGVALPSAILVRFRREIKPLQKVLIRTRYVWWEGKTAYSESEFVCAKTGFIHAHALQVEKFGKAAPCSIGETFAAALKVEASFGGGGKESEEVDLDCPEVLPEGNMPEGVRAFQALNDWSSAACVKRTPLTSCARA